MFKKIITNVVVLAMVAGLVACGSSAKKEEVSENNQLNFGLLTLDNSQNTGISDIDRILLDKDLKEDDKEKLKNIKAVHYDNLTSAILGLDRGDVGNLVLPKPVSDYIMNKNKDKYESVNVPKRHVVLVMAAMKDKQDVIDEINNGLRAIMSNHKYDDIYKKYILLNNTDGDEKLPHFDDAKTIKVAITGDLPPFDYMNAAGEAQGFNVALLSAMAEATHVNYELVACDSGARAITASTGKADAIFWMSGDAMDENGTDVDYSNDVPENMIVSDRYAIVPNTNLWLAANKDYLKDRQPAQKME